MSGNLTLAYDWVVQTCNAPNVGYSQVYRTGRTVNGITYYDCSSLISKALNVAGMLDPNPWFTTATCAKYLTMAGGIVTPITSPWQKGDVIWRAGHMEMVYEPAPSGSGGITMGAHSSKYPLPDQVSINKYISSPSQWSKLWRFPAGVTVEWIKGNRFLTPAEMKNNAYIIYSTLYFKGYTLNAIAGILGNMQRESTVNPGIWQNLDPSRPDVLGFGLVGWTPGSNYISWANSHGYDADDGYGQLEWIDTETDKGNWLPVTGYKISWDEFKASTEEPEYLASAYMKNFERPGTPAEEDRRKFAREWYEYLQNISPYPPSHKDPRRDRKSVV